MAEQSIVLLRPKEIWKRSGKCRTALYNDLAKGLMPPLISIGARAKALPAHEVDAINAARVAGKTEDEIRALVKRLQAARTSTAVPMAA